MKAPKYQAMEMLEAALREAVHELEDPIEGLAMSEKGVIAWAGGRHILLSIRWDNEYAENGAPMLGGGAWTARYVSECEAPRRPFS